MYERSVHLVGNYGISISIFLTALQSIKELLFSLISSMQRITSLLFNMFLISQGFSQIPVERISKYEEVKASETVKTVTIKMPYAKWDVLSITGDTNALSTAGDMLIDIVCTEFPTNANLNMLNNARLATFYKLFPTISPKQVRIIKVLRQLDGSEKSMAQEMFHGLVIKFRPAQTKETMKNDLARLDKILADYDSGAITRIVKPLPGNALPYKKIKSAGPRSDSLLSRYTIPLRRDVDFLCIIRGGERPDWLKKYHFDSSCYLNITPEEALRSGYISLKEYNGTRKSPGWKTEKLMTVVICGGSHQDYESIVKVYTKAPEPDDIPLRGDSLNTQHPPLPDSGLYKLFTRNKWTNMDIVGDVTASMYPYSAQLLLWLRLQSPDSLPKYYTFFNDGDDKPNGEKIIGSTGGIHSAVCGSFSQVQKLVRTTMMKGSGGDFPENDIEALLQSEKRFSGIAFHVLIADNWAPIRDMKLANQLLKPVRVVLCGVVDGAINTDCLDLARITKGSIHLMEQDLFDFKDPGVGERIKVGTKTYELVNGHYKVLE